MCPHCREGKSEAKKQTQTAKEEHRQLVNEEDESCGGGSLNRLQTRKNWHPTQRKKYNIVMGKKKKQQENKTETLPAFSSCPLPPNKYRFVPRIFLENWRAWRTSGKGKNTVGKMLRPTKLSSSSIEIFECPTSKKCSPTFPDIISPFD